ncbi:DsbA family protein [Solemya velum gill symbiont]|uniref:DsbA family protein n=1 Tax=Solemya velum gill symbiont TaxID=2340 RepID=UPI000998469A|nr:DsbA family protein [Solemya velum gill symbiont]OOY51453.1 hypothetical protein BOV97_07910 [Solemya velum gill symbiont]OOY55395.1 hypothetical protein BOV99_07455 [Solemya velum gill symbiont]OOY56681.1 hypothetical protein BOW00_06710 [Solemya velum gill symbiont]OOY59859.1 hypothetical protein BOW02_07260 [Solemya velum gill symbiont]OOY62181.1 hypothetical protein BOW04_07140 [Solemya velum gill symbiont]
MKQKPILYYTYDPMCSWTYGFEATRRELFEKLGDSVEIEFLVGGLAPDSDDPMPEETRSFLQQTWHKIEQRVPGVHFNFDFWEKAKPRRSTYPACRAVIAARHFGPEYEGLMTAAIQRAYYQEARNPSDDSTLIELAAETGLNADEFAGVLSDPATQQKLLEEIGKCRAMKQDSYPSLLLEVSETSRWQIAIDYNNEETMREMIVSVLRNEG